MAKRKPIPCRIDELKRERAELIQRYKNHEIKAAECIAEKNRLDELIFREMRK